MSITIAAAAPFEGSPTKQHINACWHNQPRLNPAAFREVLTFTAGKLWLDLRTYIPPRDDILLDAWQQGINGWLFSPRTLAAFTLPEGLARDTLVIALESGTTDAPAQPVDIFFWRNATPDIERLATLEHLARDGHTAVYGLAANTPPPLHSWLAAAEAAAQQVHGRRKRPALRALLVPLNFTETAALHHTTCQHHDEAVSPLEFTARLGWAVLADHAAELHRTDGQYMPLTTPAAPAPEALAALEAAAVAEQALHQALNGWPEAGGRRLFSLLAHLGAGEPPFISAEAGLAWATLTLPDTLLAWHNLNRPEAALYMESLRRLAFHAPPLGQAAAGAATARLLQALPPLPAGNPAAQAVNLVASLPGVAGALASPQNLRDLMDLMRQPDAPDPAPYFIT